MADNVHHFADMNGRHRCNASPVAQDLLKIGQEAFLSMATLPLTMFHLYNHQLRFRLQLLTSWWRPLPAVVYLRRMRICSYLQVDLSYWAASPWACYAAELSWNAADSCVGKHLGMAHAVPELWPERVMMWRAVVCKLWLTCTQIITCTSLFSAGPDRVEIAISSWTRCLDKSNIWKLLYSMSVCLWWPGSTAMSGCVCGCMLKGAQAARIAQVNLGRPRSKHRTSHRNGKSAAKPAGNQSMKSSSHHHTLHTRAHRHPSPLCPHNHCYPPAYKPQSPEIPIAHVALT